MTTATDNYTGVTLKSLLENPNLLIPPRCKDEDKKEGWSDNMDASSAFLGPTLWDKTLPYDGNDFKLEYMDLDEFLSENGIPISAEENKVSSTTESKLEKDDSQSSQSSHDDFDPRKRAFSEEELKPQPMIKKSKKQFVPEELKDEKYWARRGKNNMAAKRSRDARRVKENQIAIGASYLEKENDTLKLQLENLSKENQVLKDKLAKLENSSH